MSVFRSIWRKLVEIFTDPPQFYFDPLETRIPARYKEQVRAAFWRVTKHLEGIGWHSSKHQVRRVEIVPGTVKRPLGWAVPLALSPSGYAGGWVAANRNGEATRIVLVCDPNTGEIMDSSAAHEWGEAILFTGGITDLDKRHQMLTSASVNGVFA